MNDILLALDSYPEPTPDEAIDQAVGFCAAIGGKLTALALEIDIHVKPGWLAESLVHVSKLADAEEARSRGACKAMLARFRAAAEGRGVFGGAVTARADLSALGSEVARRARTRDLCIVPVAARDDGQRAIAEDVLFESGRPVLLFNPSTAPLPTESIERVMIGWDGGRWAARAVADALPILARAREVSILTVLHDKASAGAGAGEDVVRWLATHGVSSQRMEISAANQAAGEVLASCAREARASLLVMGGYGRSRLREFVLGGATQHLLGHVTVPLLLSH